MERLKLIPKIVCAGLILQYSLLEAQQVINFSHPGNGPYTTIQSAINDAATVTGDTLHIGAGTFSENVTVNKSILLWGQGTTTIISPSSGKGITVTANKVSLHDLKVHNAPSYGILGSSVKSLTLSNVVCEGDSVGAQMNSVDTLNISGSIFSHNNNHGFLSSGGHNFTLTNCTAIGNGKTIGTGSGMKFLSLAGTSTITNSTVDSNKYHGMEIGGNSKNITVSGGEFKFNGTSNPSNGGGIYIYARSSTVSNVSIIGPLTASNNVTAGIYVDGNTSTLDSIKALSIGQSGGTVTLTSNGSTQGTGVLVWGNISNATITANFSQGSVSNSAGLVIVGQSSGANSPANITIANSTFNAGYTSSNPAITLADKQPTPGYIDTNGVSATGNTWPVGANIDALIYDSTDNANLGVVTHSGDLYLPVELVSFDATVSGNSVTLVWSTATEVNNYGYDIQREQIRNPKSQIRDWTSLGFLYGSGTSASPHSYSYTDRTVSVGSYVYRLKQIDQDGTYSYSGEVGVEIRSASDKLELLQNYPNPANPSTRIVFTVPVSAIARLEIFDLAGRKVARLFEGQVLAGERNEVSFQTGELASGMYFYRLESEGLKAVRKMLILK